jgi:hypothetical protein
MNKCLISNLLTALSMLLVAHGMANMATTRLEADNKAQADRLASYQTQALNDAVEAKKQALVAIETARVQAEELNAAKKKLATCR